MVALWITCGLTSGVTYQGRQLREQVHKESVMKQLDPIEELYDMYSEEEDSPKIVEIVDDNLDMDSDLGDGLADLYLEL